MNRNALKQMLDDKGHVPVEKREYTIKKADGTDIGTVSYKAYKAINEDRLDKYTPKNDDEKQVLDRYKQYAADVQKNERDIRVRQKYQQRKLTSKSDQEYAAEEKAAKKEYYNIIKEAVQEGNRLYAEFKNGNKDALQNAEKKPVDEAYSKWQQIKAERAEANRYRWLTKVNVVAKKYGINPESFNGKEMMKWTGDNIIGKNVSEQVRADEHVLENLARENDQKSFASKNKVTATIASAGTVAAAPVRGVVSTLATVDDAQKAFRGIEVDPYSDLHSLGNSVNTIRSTVTDNIDSKVGKFAYNVGMSVGDNVMNLLTAKVLVSAAPFATAAAAGNTQAIEACNKTVSGITTFLMSSDATANAIVENKKKGRSDMEAVGLGIASGAIEALTEKYSIDEILKQPSTLIKGMLRGALAEGSEEGVSNIANGIVDVIVNGNDNDYRRSINQYKKEGASYEEAFKKTLFESLAGLGTDILSGAVSGAVMSGASQWYNTINEGSYYKTNGSERKNLIQAALANNEKTKSYNYAQKLAKNDGAASSLQLGHLYNLYRADSGTKATAPGNASAATSMTDTIGNVKHTTEMKKIMREYETAVDPNIAEFAQYAVANPNDNRSALQLNDVTHRQAADIKKLTGIDVDGFGAEAKANTFRHIHEEHGENGTTDHSMTDVNDVARMQYVIDNYDNMELLPTNSQEFRDSQQKKAPLIKMSKRIDGTYYVVEAVPDTNRKKLEVVTAYKNKAAEQQALIMQTENTVAPVDVRNVVADTTSGNRISQDTNAVKAGNVYKNSENNNVVRVVSVDGDRAQVRIGNTERIRNVPTQSITERIIDGRFEAVADNIAANTNTAGVENSLRNGIIENNGGDNLGRQESEAEAIRRNDAGGNLYAGGVRGNAKTAGTALYNQEQSYRGAEREDIGRFEKAEPGEVSKLLSRPLYHGTTANITAFQPSYTDIGIHFGTQEQARARVSDSQNARIIEANVDIKNPLYVREDIFGERTPQEYLDGFLSSAELTDGQKRTLSERYAAYERTDINEAAKQSLKDKLAKGTHDVSWKVEHDGIYVELSVKDGDGANHAVPRAEIISFNEATEKLSADETVSFLSGNVSEAVNSVIQDVAIDKLTHIEADYLRLRNIENAIRELGYDGIVYPNQNEGEGYSAAVFSDDQIKRQEALFNTALSQNKADVKNGDVYYSKTSGNVSKTGYGYVLSGMPTQSETAAIANEAKQNGAAIELSGVQSLGNVVLMYDESVNAEQVQNDINAYYNGIMPESAISDNSDFSDISFSIEHTTDNTPAVVIKENMLDNVPQSEWVKKTKEAISGFSGGIPVSGRLIKVGRVSKNEYTNSRYTKMLKAEDGTIYKDKLNAANNLDEIVLASTNYINEDLKHERKDNIKQFARGSVLLQVGDNQYSAEVIIGFTGNNEMLLYDVVNLTPTTFATKKSAVSYAIPEKQARIRDTADNRSSRIGKSEIQIPDRYDSTDFINTNISQDNSGVNTYNTQISENDSQDNSDDSSDLRFSVDKEGQIKENYSSAVNEVINIDNDTAKKYAENRLVVELMKETPSVILDNIKDAENLSIIMDYPKFYMAIRGEGVFKGHYHNLGAEIAERIPALINNPDAIVRLKNGRLNILATLKTERGNNGVISVELNSAKDINGKNSNYNVVVTMFGADNNYIENLLSRDGISVAYKNENLSQVNPQLYKWLATINDKFSTDPTISQDNSGVNTYNTQISENDSQEEIYNGRGDLLSNGSGERTNGESSGESLERVAGRTRSYQEGRETANQRREYCKTVKANGNTTEKTIRRIKAEFIDESAYNDEMKFLAAENEKRGIKTLFITGDTIIAFSGGKRARGVFFKRNNTVIVRYDHPIYSPCQINRHEIMHNVYRSEKVQAAKNYIINSLSVSERYKAMGQLADDYNNIIDDDPALLTEEFICDIFAGMSEYSKRFADITDEFWNGYDNANLDIYTPNDYTESIDAGTMGLYEENTNTGEGALSETGDNSRRVGGISEVNRDKRSRHTSDKRMLSIESSEISDKETYNVRDAEWNGRKRSGSDSLVRHAQNNDSKEISGGQTSDGRRFLEAVNNGDEQTARELLNAQAERNGFIPVNVYHGTYDNLTFTEFDNSGKANWVSTNEEYSKRYVDNENANDQVRSAQLHTAPNSGVYDLYIKPGKILEVGNINRNINNPQQLLDFAEKNGFSKEEILSCWNVRLKNTDNQIWAMTITAEFADMARRHGYDSIHAFESNGRVDTYGVLYPENIKSAKIETFDEDGKFVPLENRFDTSSRDIRFSVDNEPFGDVLSPAEAIRSDIDRNKIEPYSDKEISNWKNSKNIVVYKSRGQFLQFVNDVLKNNRPERKVYFGKVGKDTALKIKEQTGIDVSGYNISVKGYEIRKILLNSHGNAQTETLRGQEAIDVNDLLRIPEIITNPDYIALSDKLYNGNRVIEFRKEFDGKTVVISYVSGKHHDLQIQTMYKNKKRSLATMPSETSPLSHTSETFSGTASSDITLSQNKEDVNSSIRRSFENDTDDIRFSVDDSEIPYNEKRQLDEYIMQKNNGRRKLSAVDCKEIGNNFYIWRNNSKTDYAVIAQMEIEGNEDFIDWYRRELGENDGRTKDVWRMYDSFNAGQRSGVGSRFNAERFGTDARNDSVPSGQSSRGQINSDRRGDFGESRGDISDDDIRFSVDNEPFGDVLSPAEAIRNDIDSVTDKPKASINMRDISRICASILDNTDLSADRGFFMDMKDKRVMATFVNNALNSTGDKRTGNVDKLASYVARHILVPSDESGGYSQRLVDVLDKEDRTVFAVGLRDSLQKAFAEHPYISEMRSGLSADRAEQNDRLREKYEDKITGLIERYGAAKTGENPARTVRIPKKVSDKKVISQFARTMMEAGVTPDYAVSEFEKRVLDGTMTHEEITNKKAEDNAREAINDKGFEKALEEWHERAKAGKTDKSGFVLGMELYNQCVTNKDVYNAMKIAAELAAEATRAGQTLQATRMLKRMSPDGQLYFIEMSVERMNAEFRKRFGDKYKDIDLSDKRTQSLMEKFLKARTETERNGVYDKLCQAIADKIPSTALDKWNSWRYLAMLGNPQTHIRNIVGNFAFLVAVRTKNYIAAGLEAGAEKIGKLETAERTKAFRKSKEAAAFAEKDFEKIKDILQNSGGGKYTEISDIESKRRIFNGRKLDGSNPQNLLKLRRMLETLRTKNFEALEWEDLWFLEKHYKDALARLITARGLDVNSIDEDTLEKLRAYAIKEAQTATFRNENKAAQALNKWQRNTKQSDEKYKVFKRIGGAVVEGSLPFKSTPFNMAVQGAEYAAVKPLFRTFKMLFKKGTYSTAEIIDTLATLFTGGSVILLGWLLTHWGVLYGPDDKDKKKAAFDKTAGEQSYAIKIPGLPYTITLDWMAPVSLPLFVGNKIYTLRKKELGDTSPYMWFRAVYDAATAPFEPLIELSVLSGINDLIKGIQYDDSVVTGLITKPLSSYIKQAFPTIGGKISRIADGTKRNYYYNDKDSPVPAGMQRFFGQVASKLPGASYLFEPAIDRWGRDETYGGLIERGVENFILPGYLSKKNYTDTDKTLKELYEKTGNSAVFPGGQAKYYTEDKVRYNLTAEEYTEASRLRGKKSYELVSNLIKNRTPAELLVKQDNGKNKKQELYWKDMDDDQRVKAITKCYNDAAEYAKEIVLEKVKRRRSSER